MRIVEGKGLVAVKTLEGRGDLNALTRLMKLSTEISDSALTFYGTERVTAGMTLMGIADRLADEVGLLADRSGYTVDEVTAPLWKEATSNTTQAA